MAEEIINADSPIRLFVLGAGFSAPTGAPVMSNFLNESRKIFVQDQIKYSAFNDVYKFQNKMGGAQRRLDIDLDNIETLYGLAEWGKAVLEQGPTIFNSFNKLISTTLSEKIDLRSRSILRDYHRNTDFDTTFNWSSEQNRGDRFQNVSVYERFLKSTFEDGKISKTINVFLSLNYDLILEKSLNNLGIKFEILGIGDNKYYNLSNDRVYILKPHGSLNWELKDNEIQLTKEVIENPVIIPPSWLKTVHSNTVIESSVKEIWKVGIGVINKVSEIYVLGFSLPDTDQYIRSLISFGLASNVNLTHVGVVDRSEITLDKWVRLLTRSESLEDLEESPSSNFVSFYKLGMVDALHTLEWLKMRAHVLGR